jgi:hypothetical protein
MTPTDLELLPKRSRNRDTSVTYGAVYAADGSIKRPAGNKTVWTGKQITLSEGHRKSHNGKYYEGGPFLTAQVKVEIPTRFVHAVGTNGDRYDGPVNVPLVPTNLASTLKPNLDSSYLDPIGADAIHIVDPTNPNAQTGVALGEIVKDRYIPIPGINAWRRRTEVAKAASGEYLNAVFGWLPLVNDMKNTAQSVLDGNVILENYHNSSGTNVHREFEFPHIESQNEAVIGSSIAEYGGSNPKINSGTVPVTRREVLTTRRWFSGSFTYLANSNTNHFAKCLGIGSDAEKLFGLPLTPDLVWELTPWSWAVDWFTNVGSVISNVNSFAAAGLVMRYGYIMEETSNVATYSIPFCPMNGVNGTLPPCTVTTTVKRRRSANPFGFGLTWEGLSPTQLAISAALGILHLR